MNASRIPVLEPTVHEWACPACGLEKRTREVRPHMPMHDCAGARGMTIPMLAAGTKAKIEAHDREDYVGSELVQADPSGRPIMSITTERDDGRLDVRVYAPAARGGFV